MRKYTPKLNAMCETKSDQRAAEPSRVRAIERFDEGARCRAEVGSTCRELVGGATCGRGGGGGGEGAPRGGGEAATRRPRRPRRSRADLGTLAVSIWSSAAEM